jgi:hypothetical protein
MRTVSRSSVVLLAVAISGATAYAVDGVKGTVVRPIQVKAKVGGCKIAEPMAYNVHVGDAIELDYTYPIVPVAIPKNVRIKQTSGGAVDVSPLGIRQVVAAGLLGASTIGFYLDAKQAGQEAVIVVIDDNEYNYIFNVH